MTDLAPQISSVSPTREAWRSFRRNVPAMAGLVILVAIIAATLYGSLVYDGDPYDIVWAPHEPPGVTPEFPLGTDYLGRDIIAGLLSGGGPTLPAIGPLGCDYAPDSPWPGRPSRLVDYSLNDPDDSLLTKSRLAPVTQGRRTGPAQKREPPAR